jgi:hypothetical protein
MEDETSSADTAPIAVITKYIEMAVERDSNPI